MTAVERPRTIHRVRVGYGDTDQARVVHHASYLRYLEQARVEFLRDNGLEYGTWEKKEKVGLPVVELSVRYRAPARFDDLLEIETWVGKATRASITFVYRVRCGIRVLADATVRLACVGLEDGVLHRVPDEVLRACWGPAHGV